jgi:ABC-2 type transport system ATP-binding protein
VDLGVHSYQLLVVPIHLRGRRRDDAHTNGLMQKQLSAGIEGARDQRKKRAAKIVGARVQFDVLSPHEARVVAPGQVETGAEARSRILTPISSRPLVSFEGVSRHFGRGASRRPVLRSVNLHIGPGTAVCITGGNGAGKTTLLRLATGILAPQAGRVIIDGIGTGEHWRELHRRIGFLSAGDRGLYARLSVGGHLSFWTALAFVPRRDRKRLVEEALVRFGLGDLAKRRADRLSLGQRQRLRLALTTLHRPKVLLLDEPRSSLDAEGLNILCSSVGDVLEREGSVLWCSPLGEEQPMSFERTLLLADGELRPV